MSKARDRSSRSGSDPIQIGSTKLVTDASNNLSVTDTSDAPTKLIASEIEIGDSSNKVIIKKGTDNKVQFQTQASGGSATDSNAGGGVTVVADLTALQAITGTAVGDLAFVTANSKVYLRTSTGWYTTATVTNATPVVSSAGNASYAFATDGTPVVIDITATDSEGETITYGHTVTGSASGIATITQGTGANVNRFTLTPATSGSGGSFSVTFTAQDPNGNTGTSSASSFTLSFGGSTNFPRGAGGSNTNVGTADFITAGPDSDDFHFGTGDFTVECWINLVDDTSWRAIVGQWACASSTGIATINAGPSSWYMGVTTNGNYISWYSPGNYNYSTTAPTLNTWQHVVAQRSSGTLKMFLAGTQIMSVSYTADLANSPGPITIGGAVSNSASGMWKGGISNVRIVKGSAVYTPSGTSITVPTAPLTAITGTVLLTCQNSSGTITDASSANRTITVYGNAAAQTSNPF